MNTTISQLCAEFEKMESTIAFQQKIISALPKQPTVPCGCPMMVNAPLENYPKLKLADCSWNEINMYAQSGMADRVFALGDTKEITLADGSSINVRIIGFNHDQNDNGQVIPITFESVETLNEDAQMNDEYTNKGGWSASKLRSSMNDHFFNNMLPEDLKAVIKSCAKMTGTGGKSPKMGNTVDKLFLLSEQEIFGRKIYSIGGEGHWYDYYKQENVGYGKCKQNGESDWRWERSPYGSSTSRFCFVNSGGSANCNDASSSNGVSFGFCV